MEYTVSKLAHLSGVSARTLRYYDEIELLKPKRINSSGYRIYGRAEVDLLQQILFFREMGFSLDEIRAIIYSSEFDVETALKDHLNRLQYEKERLEKLINTVEKSIQAKRGEIQMTDKEKFEAFKKDMLDKNEEQYGNEAREKYGEESYEEAKKKFKNITPDQWEAYEKLNKELNNKLAEATEISDPASELAQEVCDLHRQWLMFFWPEGHYDKEKHYNLTMMYVADQRFAAYYEKIAPGATQLLHEAVKIYAGIKE